jgi:hypothetical protein
MDTSHIFRPLVPQIPGQPDPTSQDALDLQAGRGLPDPNITGPCQVQSSPFCEPSAGAQRMNPTDMLEIETAFQGYVQICQPCYDHQADLFIAVRHEQRTS